MIYFFILLIMGSVLLFIVNRRLTDSATLKVYQMDEYQWWCACSIEEAVALYKQGLVVAYGENTSEHKEAVEEMEPRELTKKELNTLTFYDDSTNPPRKRTFRKELARRISPGFFATTEC